MTKTISIYTAQILLGLIAIAAGYAKLSGAGVMVHHLHAIGLGPGFLMVAGTCEIVAGLCLLLPRGGILGAFLLASVTRPCGERDGCACSRADLDGLSVQPRSGKGSDFPRPDRVGHLINRGHSRSTASSCGRARSE